MSVVVRQKMFGLLAEYESAADIYHACEMVRDAGYKKWDACVPFPVHGLDKAMGLKDSYLPWLVLVAGIAGAVCSMGFMIWVSAFDYPFNIGGKPTLSIAAFIPVAFEITVLFGALTAAFGMFFINKLPRFHHPLFRMKRFERVTDDRFFIVIESEDPAFEVEQTRELLVNSGATALEVVEP